MKLRVLTALAIASSVVCYANSKDLSVRPKIERDSEVDEYAFGVSWEYEKTWEKIGGRDFSLSFATEGTVLDDKDLNQDGMRFELKSQEFIVYDSPKSNEIKPGVWRWDQGSATKIGFDGTYFTKQDFSDDQYFASVYFTLVPGNIVKDGELSLEGTVGKQVPLPSFIAYFDLVSDRADTTEAGLPFADDEFSRIRMEVYWGNKFGKDHNYFIELRARYFKELGRGSSWETADLDDAYHYLARIERSFDWLSGNALFVEYRFGRPLNAFREEEVIAFGIKL